MDVLIWPLQRLGDEQLGHMQHERRGIADLVGGTSIAGSERYSRREIP